MLGHVMQADKIAAMSTVGARGEIEGGLSL